MRTIGAREGYDLWAATYDGIDNPMVAMTVRAMERWAPRARSVLEIGCGTGRHAPFLLARGVEEYVGVDVSPGMLAEARRKHADPRARFLEVDLAADVGAGRAAPLAPGAFDGVLVSLVLEHVADVAPLLRAAADAARPGAWLRVYELHPHLRAQGTRAHFRTDEGETYLPSHPHTVAEIRDATAGLWEIRSTTDWYADPIASAKAARYRGQPMLLEIDAVRAAGAGAR